MSLMSLSEEDTAFVGASVNDGDAVFIDRDDISNYNPGQVLPESPEHIRKIRSWLQPTSYDDVGGEYRKHLDPEQTLPVAIALKPFLIQVA